ncbi:hypothetical protein ACH4T9_12430 [Micromonospora sp. NPDC020750]|uniref:hypothetical protein n=1 Tax=unclassified Micromonospora TaxID=2617518 RepID=UPI00378EAFEC
MSALDDNPTLVIALQAAVQLRILELRQHHPATRDRLCSRWAADAVDPVASRADAMQYGGKRGEAAQVFNALARGLAAAAFNPGGVTAFGEHWCVDHAACEAADRQAADAPSLLDRDPEPDQPSAPTFRGRPLVDVTLPEVA